MKLSSKCWYIVSVLAWSVSAFAADFQSPRTAAIGGAGHASPMLNDAIYLNPSFATFLPSYSISGNYAFFGGPKACDNCGPSDPHGHSLNASIQDGRSELFQAGVGLTLFNDRKVINIGASRSIVERLGVGIGGKWVIPEINSPPLLWDMMISSSYVPLEWLQLALVIDNLFEQEKNLAYGMYREFVLGSKANIMDIMLVYFDPHLAPSAPNNSTFGHELGLEFPFMKDFFLRAGHFRNAAIPAITLRGGGFAFGAGWIAPRSSFDFAFQRVLDPVLCNIYSFAMTVYF